MRASREALLILLRAGAVYAKSRTQHEVEMLGAVWQGFLEILTKPFTKSSRNLDSASCTLMTSHIIVVSAKSSVR